MSSRRTWPARSIAWSRRGPGGRRSSSSAQPHLADRPAERAALRQGGDPLPPGRPAISSLGDRPSIGGGLHGHPPTGRLEGADARLERQHDPRARPGRHRGSEGGINVDHARRAGQDAAGTPRPPRVPAHPRASPTDPVRTGWQVALARRTGASMGTEQNSWLLTRHRHGLRLGNALDMCGWTLEIAWDGNSLRSTNFPPLRRWRLLGS
jgi:hypothetical protein